MAADEVVQLLPCPFCGSEHIDYAIWPAPEGDSHYIVCLNCEANGRQEYSEREAVAAWNTRAALTSAKAQPVAWMRTLETWETSAHPPTTTFKAYPDDLALYLHPPSAPVEGVCVPSEPTEEMLSAGGRALGNYIKALVAKDPAQALSAKGKPRGLVIGWREKMMIRYKAMLAAAPQIAATPTKEVVAVLPWQPIATAPLDGTNVIAGVEGVDRSAGEAFYWEGGWRTWDGENHTRTIMYPTHWMPIPQIEANPTQPHSGAGEREAAIEECAKVCTDEALAAVKAMTDLSYDSPVYRVESAREMQSTLCAAKIRALKTSRPDAARFALVPVDADEEQAFRKWASDRGMCVKKMIQVEPFSDTPDWYADDETHTAWKAWKHRATLPMNVVNAAMWDRAWNDFGADEALADLRKKLSIHDVKRLFDTFYKAMLGAAASTKQSSPASEAQRFDCPIHGLQDGPDCPRC